MTDQTRAATDRPARILIVDDEPLNVDYLEQELERHGFLTETAADGLEALERVAADPPDLVLLDVMMPRMDGLSALRILKEDSETRLIPVVLMTAMNAVEDRVRGIEAGADDFLSKPVDDRELLARIKTALDHKRAIEEAVGELRSTSAHLARYGRQTREVAVLVLEWRLRDGELPDEAVGFVARREREAAEELIVAGGGTPSEGKGGQLVAVFDGPDSAARTAAAVQAALAVAGERSTRADTAASAPVRVSAAISVGAAEVGSTRVTEAAGPRWVYGVTGQPVERASALARSAAGAAVLVTGDAAAVVSDRFRLEPAGDAAYRVLGLTAGDGKIDAARSPLDRRVRTVLVTDIVGSTITAERIGDRAWGELVTAHERATRDELVLFGGDEIDTTGDGFVASFDSPAAAIHCALAVVDRVAALGLAIRAGIHTGEIEYVEGTPRGIALHVASRIAAKADGGEILVSSTTRELAAGARLAFADRGEHVLRGMSESRRLYAAAEKRAHGSVRTAGATSATPVAGTGRTEYPAGLTAREVDVLRLVAVGHSDAEVAEQLVLSVRTVNAHVRSIYRKAGVRSRAAAGRFAEENGLL
jgi:DNA-binding NarL/FixJ family response regulator